jgi:hypothetical protein
MSLIETITSLIAGQPDELCPEDFIHMHFTVTAREPEDGGEKSYVIASITDDGWATYGSANSDKINKAHFPKGTPFRNAELFLNEDQWEKIQNAIQSRIRRNAITINPASVRAKINAEVSQRFLIGAAGQIQQGGNPNGLKMLEALVDAYPELSTGTDAENENTLRFLLDVDGRVKAGEATSLTPRQYHWVRDVAKRYGERRSQSAA